MSITPGALLYFPRVPLTVPRKLVVLTPPMLAWPSPASLSPCCPGQGAQEAAFRGWAWTPTCTSLDRELLLTAHTQPILQNLSLLPEGPSGSLLGLECHSRCGYGPGQSVLSTGSKSQHLETSLAICQCPDIQAPAPVFYKSICPQWVGGKVVHLLRHCPPHCPGSTEQSLDAARPGFKSG